MFIKGQFLYPSQKGDFTKEFFSSLITFPLKKADQRFRQFLFSPQLSQITTYKN